MIAHLRLSTTAFLPSADRAWKEKGTELHIHQLIVAHFADLRKAFLLKCGAGLCRDFLRDVRTARLASRPLCAFSLRACAHAALNGNSHLAAVDFLVTLQRRVVSAAAASRAEQLSGSRRFKYQRG